MKKHYLFFVVILYMCTIFTTPVLASVKTKDIPPPLSRALAVYKSDGARPFISALVKGGPMEGNIEIRQQIAILEKVEMYYGKYQSFDIVDIKRFSDSTRIVYLLINFEKGAVFGKLIAFKSKQKEIVSSFVFHTKPDQVFPAALLVSQ